MGWPFTSQLALSLTAQPGVPNYKIFPPITTKNQDNKYPTDIHIGPSDLGNQSIEILFSGNPRWCQVNICN